MSTSTAIRRARCTWDTRPDTTGRWFRAAAWWFTALDITIRRILLPQCGCRLPTPTVWELPLPGARLRDGRWVSAWAWRSGRGAVRGGDRSATGAGDTMALRRGAGAVT